MRGAQTLDELLLSSARHAAAFMAGYRRIAPLSVFPMATPDPYYRKVRENAGAAKGAVTEDEILNDILIARAFRRGASLGQTMLGPPTIYSEIMQRVELKADSEDSATVCHLFKGWDNKHPERINVGRHLKNAPCDYCSTGAKNHLGDPHAAPIPLGELEGLQVEQRSMID